MKRFLNVMCLLYRQHQKKLVVMRNVFLIIIISAFQVFATGSYAQTKTVSLTMNNTSIQDVLYAIQNQSEFYFMYNSELIDVTKKVDVDIKQEKVDVILTRLFNQDEVNFLIKDRYIVLTPADEESKLFDQQRSVSGQVTDAGSLPLPGVTVLVKGTTQGTITNSDGNYSLVNIPENATLVFSFVGMRTQEVVVGSQTIINLRMVESAIGLDEVVVTALGLKREKKALGYSVGEVQSESLNRVPQKDLVSALAGKMSGVKITTTSNDVNSDTYVNIRGISSLAGNNSPLVVVDGVPAGDQRVMKDISPEDIESISVLKGPSAAALYGSRAGNGVILITSKTGSLYKKGIGVDISIGSTYSVPYKYIKLQNRFTSGISGVLNENSYQQFNGPEEGVSAVQWNTNGESKPLVFYNNLLQDFFETGLETVYAASVKGSYDRGSFRLGLSHLDADGIYPGVELKRNGVNMSTVYNITEKVKLSTNVDFLNPSSDNYPLKGGGETQYMAVYQIPPHVNINDLKDYWDVPDVQQKNINTAHDNPWFAAYELRNSFDRLRMFGNMKLDYQILPNLNIMGRYALNSNNEKMVYRQAWSSYGGDGGGSSKPLGSFNETINNLREMNSDVLISYKKGVGKFEIDPSIGGNIMTQRRYEMYAGGDPLVLPGLYTISNVNRDGLTYYDRTYKKNIYSVYGVLNISYNNMIFIETTARNDWSSTLPENNRSYFYPSASLSVLLNEMISMPSWVSLIKLRSGLSQVGKDTDPYVISQVLTQGTWGSNTIYTVPTSLPNINLKPEISKAFEIGTDVSFFSNRLGADFTFYKVQNINQILNASTSSTSGYGAATINAGNVENFGYEIGLNMVPVRTKDWEWDMSFNFTRERSKLVELTEGIDQFQFWSSTHVFAITKVGDYIGDIYTRDMIRVEDKNSPYYGWPLLNSNGKLQRNNDNSALIKVGNFLHDFMMGMQTTASYKKVSVSLSFDWRQGGKYYDQTMMRLTRAGKVEYFHDNENSSTFTGILSNNSFNGDNKALANEIKSNPEKYQQNVWIGGRTQDLGGFLYSNGVYEGAFFPGVISDGKGGYIENFGDEGTQYVKAYDIFQPSGGYWDTAVANKWIYDASFAKLREITVSYTLPESFARKMFAERISVSGFMRNIVLYSGNKTNQDPESIYNQVSNTGTTNQGRSTWNASPIVLPVGFKIDVSF